MNNEYKEEEEKVTVVTKYLKSLDSKSEKEIEKSTEGFTEEHLRQFINIKIEKALTRTESHAFTKVNEFYEYGISGETLHLHLPGDFHEMFKEKGKVKGSAILLKELIDAVDKINEQKNIGNINLKECKQIYMISPIFYAPIFYPKKLREPIVRSIVKPETPIFKLFRAMGMETKTFTKEDLRNSKFLEENSSARLAVKNFGINKDVGEVSLSFEKLNSRKFQRNLQRVDKILNKIINPNKGKENEIEL
ncbi:MAG: hypothetical protein ACI35S_06365 [Anaeroplasma sp.]